ncbi:hypothetical protein EAI_14630 [Harpegnathos saltator]|uniref:Uncharacterized protein n=1 Tax=Harpegnathos saltator TaxID=610380 RepID=E2BG13_HARSA|nr:hypothetical protein EAI_14630 [Harpegnathos saltator]
MKNHLTINTPQLAKENLRSPEVISSHPWRSGDSPSDKSKISLRKASGSSDRPGLSREGSRRREPQSATTHGRAPASPGARRSNREFALNWRSSAQRRLGESRSDRDQWHKRLREQPRDGLSEKSAGDKDEEDGSESSGELRAPGSDIRVIRPRGNDDDVVAQRLNIVVTSSSRGNIRRGILFRDI